MRQTEYVPKRIDLPTLFIVGTDVLPPRFFDTHHILDIFKHRRADIDGEVGGIIVASSLPTFLSSSLMDLLAVFQLGWG